MSGSTPVSSSIEALPVGQTEPAVVVNVSQSPAARAWRRFRRNRLGFTSLVIFCTLVVMSLFAELLSNDKPFLVRYDGHYYFPMVKDYPETTFGGDFPSTADYLDPAINKRITEGGNFALYTLNPYGSKTIAYYNKASAPPPPSPPQCLATDGRVRHPRAQPAQHRGRRRER